MTEPATNAVAGIAIATGAITLTGSFLGLQFDALLFGLAGGLFSLMYLPPMGSRWRLAGTLGAASMIGAIAAQVALPYAFDTFPLLLKVGSDVVRPAIACGVGLVLQVVIPILLALVKRRGEALT